MGYRVLPCGVNCWSIEENFVRCFLIVGQERALLLDTCLGQGNLLDRVRSLTHLPVSVAHTHADGDHTGGDQFFEQVALHEADWPPYQKDHPTDTPHAFLRDGQVLDLGGVELEVIHVPGHTPGSIALLDRQHRILFAGDTVQRGEPVFLFGPGRDLTQYIDCLRLLCSRMGEFDTILSCHGDMELPTAYLSDMLAAAEALRGGKLPAAPSGRPFPAQLYSRGRTSFLYMP